jgi:hypothetical protein
MDYLFLLSIFIAGFTLATFIFSFYRIYMLRQIKLIQSQYLLEDLELATKEQLLTEFRNRPNNSYILLMPMSSKEEMGMKIELNSFKPYDSVNLLHLATTLIFREMKNKGMSVPELPAIDVPSTEDGLQQ